MSQLRADDRVLLLAIPAHAELAAIARMLMHGTVVAIGEAYEVAEASRGLTEFSNVMLLDASPDHIPWRDGGFTKILVPPQFERIFNHIAPELHRLLAPGGTIVRTTSEG